MDNPKLQKALDNSFSGQLEKNIKELKAAINTIITELVELLLLRFKR